MTEAKKMTDKSAPPEKKVQENMPGKTEELGMFDSYGSFPVWALKLIDLITPGFLIRKSPPEKKPPRN